MQFTDSGKEITQAIHDIYSNSPIQAKKLPKQYMTSTGLI